MFCRDRMIAETNNMTTNNLAAENGLNQILNEIAVNVIIKYLVK